MWVDDEGTVHTVWVPPEEILGAASVAALGALPEDERAAAVAVLDERYDEIVDEAATIAPRGISPDDADAPPELDGPLPVEGEDLTATLLSWLESVDAEWRAEALEALADVLDPA